MAAASSGKKKSSSNGTNGAPPKRSKSRGAESARSKSRERPSSSKKKSDSDLRRSTSKRADRSRSRSRSKSRSKSQSQAVTIYDHHQNGGKSSSKKKGSKKEKNDYSRSQSTNTHATKQSKASKASSSNKKSKKGANLGVKEAESSKVGTIDGGYGMKGSILVTKDNKNDASNFKLRQQAQKYANQAKKAIPAQVRMISGSHDSQTSADVGNISSQFDLPSAGGMAGGACTAALLQVLYQMHEDGESMSWVDVLREMRDILEEKDFDQIPQLTSSRMIEVGDPFSLSPTSNDLSNDSSLVKFSKKNHTKRALLIGINYASHSSGRLSGCHNDVHNVAKYLKEVQGFKKENITILMDDESGNYKSPTKKNILGGMEKLVKESKKGDVVFCHYSGHGGRLPDDNGDEDDGYDETLIPVDFHKNGQIRDDDILKILVHPMPAGVTMTCLMDCCHSGTVLDLPYRFTADGDLQEMEINEKVHFSDAIWASVGIAAGAVANNLVGKEAAAAAAMGIEPGMIVGGGPNAIHENSDTSCCLVM